MPSIGVLEHYQKPTDKPTRRIKRSGGQSLVNRGIAKWVIENVLLQLLSVQQAAKIIPLIQAPARPDPDAPSQSPRMGKLRWEPPKSKRQFKPHPWIEIA